LSQGIAPLSPGLGSAGLSARVEKCALRGRWSGNKKIEDEDEDDDYDEDEDEDDQGEGEG